VRLFGAYLLAQRPNWCPLPEPITDDRGRRLVHSRVTKKASLIHPPPLLVSGSEVPGIGLWASGMADRHERKSEMIVDEKLVWCLQKCVGDGLGAVWPDLLRP
jgi:hypothetical protein